MNENEDSNILSEDNFTLKKILFDYAYLLH